MAAPYPLADWTDLTATLDAYAAAGKSATLWWRDDDATHPTAALDRLLAIAPTIPLALAVIPARAVPDLAARVGQAPNVRVCLHGWNHWNHAPLGAPKSELGPERPTAYVVGELARGHMTLRSLFPDMLAMLVPPHNRIAPAAATALRGAGLTGLSAFNARKNVPPGIVQTNTHIDLMDWTTRRFAGEASCLGALVGHLRAKLEARVDADEPTGILTHHLAHDEEAWAFLQRVFAALGAHRAVRFADPVEIFAAQP
ncbi:MAG: polysaccharide deacetylase family protein [Telmatospirillum sp.]|nr:polysaccharide deacetylase family protein [Telmatospirillum sp.]